MKRNLGLMSRGRNMLSKHGLKTVYYTHIYSRRSYCISVWGRMANSDLLMKLRTQQNCCMRILDPQIPVSLVYEKYNVLDIDYMIDLKLCKLGYKINHNNLPGKSLTKNTVIMLDTKGN